MTSSPRRERRTTVEKKRRKARIARKMRSLVGLGAGDAMVVCLGGARD